VFSLAWPVSARERARKAVLDVLLSVARLLREGDAAGAQLKVTRAIEQTRQLSRMGRFEAALLPAPQAPSSMHEQPCIDAAERVALAAFVVVNQVSTAADAASNDQSRRMAEWLESWAARWPASHPPDMPPTEEVVPGAGSPSERALMEAQGFLRNTIAGFASHVV
jgi:hypothetical protein